MIAAATMASPTQATQLRHHAPGAIMNGLKAIAKPATAAATWVSVVAMPTPYHETGHHQIRSL